MFAQVAGLLLLAHAMGIADDHMDVPFHGVRKIRIQNHYGHVFLQGTSTDRMKIIGVRRWNASAPVEPEKRNLLEKSVKFSTQLLRSEFQVTGVFGSGLELMQKVKERKEPLLAYDLHITAPLHSEVQVWTKEGAIQVKKWNGPLLLHTLSGAIQVDEVRSSKATASCRKCTIEVNQFQGKWKSESGVLPIQMRGVQGSIVVETTDGTIEVQKGKGDFLLSTQKGEIRGQGLSGRLDFQSREGKVTFLDFSGFLSGFTRSSDILAEVREWVFKDNGFIESDSGAIQLTLPSVFEGLLEARAQEGQVQVQFPLVVDSARRNPLQKGNKIAPPDPQHWIVGRAGKKSDGYLRLESKKGNISVYRGI